MTVSRPLANTDPSARTSLRTMSVSVTRAMKVCETSGQAAGRFLSGTLILTGVFLVMYFCQGVEALVVVYLCWCLSCRDASGTVIMMGIFLVMYFCQAVGALVVMYLCWCLSSRDLLGCGGQ